MYRFVLDVIDGKAYENKIKCRLDWKLWINYAYVCLCLIPGGEEHGENAVTRLGYGYNSWTMLYRLECKLQELDKEKVSC